MLKRSCQGKRCEVAWKRCEVAWKRCEVAWRRCGGGRVKGKPQSRRVRRGNAEERLIGKEVWRKESERKTTEERQKEKKGKKDLEEINLPLICLSSAFPLRTLRLCGFPSLSLSLSLSNPLSILSYSFI